MTTAADPVAGYAGFAAALREAGVACDAHRVQAYLTAVAEIDVAEPTRLYWAGRLTLCSSPDDLPCYEEAFSQWFSIETSTPKRATSAAPKKARIGGAAVVTWLAVNAPFILTATRGWWEFFRMSAL
ncbi:hypothetical protein ABT262_16250, partial [Amycolatopsis mediterranei]